MTRRFDIFSLGVSIPALYVFLFFVVPLLHNGALQSEVSLLVATGTFAFVAGYLAVPSRIFAHVRSFVSAPWDSRRALWAAGVLGMLGLAGKTFRILGGGYFHVGRDPVFIGSPFASVAGYLDWAGLLAFGMALLMHFSLAKQENSAAMRWKFVAGAFFLLEFFYALFSCGREAVVAVVLTYILIRWYAAGMRWWHAALALAITAAIIFPFGNACRNPLKLGVRTIADVPRAVENLPSLAAESFVSRLDLSTVLAEVRARDLSDFKSDFVSDFASSFGPPRFLWTEKPVAINARGNEFGHRIGVLAPDDSSTAVAPTFLGDLFINFGFAGVMIGMMFFGALAKVFYTSLGGRSGISFTGTLVYSVVWIELMRGTEGWIVPLFAGLVKLLILVLVIHLVVRSRPEAAVAATP